MARCRGGYAVTVLINGYGILAFRDPHGVRPLCMGARPGGDSDGVGIVVSAGSVLGGVGSGGTVDGRRGSGKMDLAVASESAALTGLGFALRRDVGAGEAVFLDAGTGSVSSRFCAPEVQVEEGENGAGEGAMSSRNWRGGGRESGRGEGGGGRRGGGKRTARFKPCLFEYVYMARPDSIIDGVPVRKDF